MNFEVDGHRDGAVPGWVMCGEQLPDGRVCLYASNKLTQAELEEETAGFSSWGLEESVYRRTSYTITATMDNLVLITAEDWPSAFRALFNKWSPDEAAQPQIQSSPTRPV